MQKITIIGNLGQDAERKEINEKNALVMNVGATTGYGDKKETTWFEVVLFTKMEQLEKGTRVFVSGKPKFTPYKKKNGDLAVDCKIYANDFEIVARPTQQQEQAAF